MKQFFGKTKNVKIWLALVLASVCACVCTIGSREVTVTPVTLLYNQSYQIPAGGRVSFDGGEGTAVAFDQEARTVTGAQRGEATVRVHHLTRVEEYQFSVYPPAPEGAQEQKVTVDGQTRLAKYPENNYPVQWSSSDEDVATVENGVVTGKKAGTAEITETLNNCLTYTYTVTVPKPEVESDSYTLYAGETTPLAVDNYEQTVDWSAKDETVKVSEDGLLTAEEPGETTVEAEIGGELLAVSVNVAEDPVIEEEVELQTDETAQLHVENAIDTITYTSEDETIAKVNDKGKITPVGEGTTTITATIRNKELSSEVTVKLTPEEEFRKNNYGDYQPDTSVAALTMIGMCSYYNDRMKADGDKWYDTNLTSFSAADTFSQGINASRKGTNCNTLLNWSWADMGLKSGSSSLLYGDKNHRVHAYNSGSTSLQGTVDSHCSVSYTGGTKFKTLVSQGKVKPGDMLFGKIHTFIYRGEGTVFASAGDARCHHEGKKLVMDDFVNGSASYDWNQKVYYLIRFNDDCIPRYYRDKTGALVENPMYTAEHA